MVRVVVRAASRSAVSTAADIRGLKYPSNTLPWNVWTRLGTRVIGRRQPAEQPAFDWWVWTMSGR